MLDPHIAVCVGPRVPHLERFGQHALALTPRPPAQGEVVARVRKQQEPRLEFSGCIGLTARRDTAALSRRDRLLDVTSDATPMRAELDILGWGDLARDREPPTRSPILEG